jgi:anaerobic selenocysteine-containing dehydrogenase
MGFTDACFDDDEPALVRTMLASRSLRDAGVDFERLAAERRAKMPAPKRTRRIALRADTLARTGVDPVPQYVPLRESREGSPEHAKRYPLAFLTPSHHLFLNSNFGSDERLRARATPSVRIHPRDAAARGIVSGDAVTIANDRGRTRMIAEVTDAVKPGTLVHLSLWWNAFSPDGANANATTSQAASDLGGGATFHTNLVEVAKTISANERS